MGQIKLKFLLKNIVTNYSEQDVLKDMTEAIETN